MKPDFLCIGAQKAGTTWLYDQLNLDSRFELPAYKELHFFDYAEKALPNDFTRTNSDNIWVKRRVALHEKLISNEIPTKDLEWHLKYIYLPRELTESRIKDYCRLLFPSDKISGDITPAYSLLSKKTIRLIRNILPDIKVLFFMRNPIDRDWSMCKMYFRNRLKKNPLDSNNVDLVKQVLTRNSQRNNYLRIIRKWKSEFGSSFKYFFYDDLKRDSALFLNSVYDFLEIDIDDISVSRNRSNASRTNEFPKHFKEILRQKHIDDIKVLAKELQEPSILSWI